MDPREDFDRRDKHDKLERFKAVVKNGTESALEVLNRISVREMSKPEPKADLVEDYFLLYRHLHFLKRFASGEA